MFFGKDARRADTRRRARRDGAPSTRRRGGCSAAAMRVQRISPSHGRPACFARDARKDEPPTPDLSTALKTQITIDAASRSSAEGGRIDGRSGRAVRPCRGSACTSCPSRRGRGRCGRWRPRCRGRPGRRRGASAAAAAPAMAGDPRRRRRQGPRRGCGERAAAAWARACISATIACCSSGVITWTCASMRVTSERSRFSRALEELEGLGLVFVQRVALGVAAEADDAAQVVERDQVLAPVAGRWSAAAPASRWRAWSRRRSARPWRPSARRSRRVSRSRITSSSTPSSSAQAATGRLEAEDLADLRGEAVDVPLVGIGLGRHVLGDEVVDHLVAHVADDVGEVLRLHDLAALGEDRLALVVHHVVVLQEVLADVEVARLDLALRLLQRLVHPRVDDRLALLHAEASEHRVEPVGPEDAHQVVLERQVEVGAARVALAAGAAAELVVDAPALVALGGEHVEAAGGDHPGLGVGDLGLDRGRAAPADRRWRRPSRRPRARRRPACRRCRRAGCRCRGRPCWWRWSPRRARRPRR